jgi:hypothetical protein
MSATCKYKYQSRSLDFKCLEMVHNGKANFCIFHNIDYLKGGNYWKNNEEVYNRFKHKLSKYLSKNMPLEFVGYYLPELSFD